LRRTPSTKPGDPGTAGRGLGQRRHHAATVAEHRDVLGEQLFQGWQITGRAGSEEPPHQFVAMCRCDGEARLRLPHACPRTTKDLAAVRWRPLDDLGDALVVVVERVA
jgi:hypothetical protein